jgi:vacuolar protein sorting-associated protein 35
VITQVFPDEFHLHTLDHFLSATGRLNPNVNVKAIIIGMMDRLSAYAARESKSQSLEEKKKLEETAVVDLLEKLRISKEEKEAKPTKHQNGSAANGEGEDAAKPSVDGESSSAASETTAADSEAPTEETAVEQSEAQETEAPEVKTGSSSLPTKVQLFEIFFEQVVSVVKTHRLPIQDIIALLVSLTNLALNIYPERLDYVDQVFSFANEKVALFANSADLHSQGTQSHILGLLLSPVKAYCSLFTALAVPNFIPLLHAQPYPTRRAVARDVIQSILTNRTEISTAENLDGLLEILKVLIKEGIQQPSGYTTGVLQRKATETDETVEEQSWLAKVVHLVYNEKNDTQYQVRIYCNVSMTCS